MFCNLEAEQARKNMTNQEMADYLKISRPTYEKKKKTGKFYVNEISLLCILFGCTYEYLFATDDKKTAQAAETDDGEHKSAQRRKEIRIREVRAVNINEATKQAIKGNKYISRQHAQLFGYGKGIKIKPTNKSDCCIVFMEGKSSAKRWNPQAEDLTADDWIVVDQINGIKDLILAR